MWDSGDILLFSSPTRPGPSARKEYKNQYCVAGFCSALGWEQGQAALAAHLVALPQPIAATGTCREIEFFWTGYSRRPWNLQRENLVIYIFREKAEG